MKKTVSQLMVLTLSLELILAPVAFAQDSSPTNPQKSNGADVALGILSIGAGIAQKLNQNNGRDAKYYTDLAGFTKQQTPQADKYFSANKLMQLPGLGAYLAINKINPAALNCSTLPTTMHEAEPEECRVGILTDRNISVQDQLGKAAAYADQYKQIEKLYKNYTATSNVSGQGFGVGCMKNAMQVLQGYFQYRVNDLDKLVTNLEAINNQFKEASKSDLNAIEEATAVLEGGNSELASKVKSTKPELFDFAAKFGDAACNSMMSGESFNELGGLNKINKDLKNTLTAKVGKFSGDSYLGSHASVVEDINQMADKVAKQVELNFTSIATGKVDYNNLFNVSSNHGLRDALSADLVADQQAAFQEKNQKIVSELASIKSEFGGRANNIINEISNPNSGAFSSELAALETQVKNECLSKAVDIGAVIRNVQDSSTSSFANENSSSFLKDKLQQIIANDKSSFAKKMSELEAVEKQYSSYYVKMQNSYEVQELDANGNLVSKVVPASTKRTPSAYLSDVIKSCEAQFKSNHLNSQMSGAAAVKKLRSIHQEYKALAKSHANDIRRDIKSKMIECSSAVDANNTAAGSCSPDLFNTASKGFCANAALSCSKNMKSCSEQADKFVKEIKTDRTARVNNYKKMVEKNKKDIIKIFDTALSQYMKEGEYLRGLFGVGFSSPTDISRDVDDSSKYLSSFQSATMGSVDGQLLIEDPEKYVDMFKRNIEQLKKSVIDQQGQILGDGDKGLLAQHVKQTETNYNKVIEGAAKLAGNCEKQYDSYVKNMEKARHQQQKELQELGEKGSEFCNRWSGLANNPNAACQKDFSDLGKVAAKADPRASADYQSLVIYCSDQNMGGDNTKNNASYLCRNIMKDETFTELRKSCEDLTNRVSQGECSKVTPGQGGTASVSTDVCTPLQEHITGTYNAIQAEQNSDGSVSNSYCTAMNGSEGTNKTLNFMQTLAREIGVQPAGTRQ